MKLKLFVFLLVCFLGSDLSARHIIGGEIFYSCVRADSARGRVTFLFTLKIYRDCYGGGATLDGRVSIGIYRKRSNVDYDVAYIKDVNLLSKRFLDPSTDNPCLELPPNVCVEEGVYEFEQTMDMISVPYVAVFQRCCRNETISNILSPGDAGAAYSIEISPEAQRLCNNSPQFNNFPPIVICANQNLDFDHGARDDDGDVFIYEFCAPSTGGGKRGSAELPGDPLSCDGVTPDPFFCPPPYNPVDFKLPFYSALNPLGGSPVVTINTATGRISGRPNTLGQFVVGVCLREYRNGVLLTTMQRDFQFNVAFCQPTVIADVASDSTILGQRYYINSCGENTVHFKNLSTKESNIKDYLWEFDIQGNKKTFTTRDATVTFPGIGTYRGIMILNKGTECSDTADIYVNLFPSIKAEYSHLYDTCLAGPVAFKDLSITGSGQIRSWDWTFEPSKKSTIKDPNYLFTTPGYKPVKLKVTDINSCADDTTIVIPYFPVPALIVVNPSSFSGCEPLTVKFENLSVPIDSTYKILWDFGDGTTSNMISPEHIFEDDGIFSVKLEITSPIGCYTSISYPGWIDVKNSPEAGFSYSPKELSSFRKDITLTDESKFAESIQWIIDDRIILYGSTNQYSFRDTGIHKITQIVYRTNGCTDTLTQYVDIEPKVTYFLPNAFTPNGDGKNDDFFGKGVLDGMMNFQINIWDRWGGKIFSTSSPSQSWNGRYDNIGDFVPVGVYVYIGKYTTPRGEIVNFKGYATVIR
ncbi:MAG: PKD domain-containing protein [Bacteroidota bacterium]|nr:PKD domain-containing protein [Bacteroidota bacterium]